MASFRSRTDALIWARDLVRRSDVLYVDTETTGVRHGYDDIVDIGIVDGTGLVIMDQLVLPAIPIPADAEAVHGISNRAVSKAPRLPDVWRDLSALLAGKMLVSYNAAFDKQMLAGAGDRRGLAPIVPAQWDCAMEAYAAYNGQQSHHRRGFRWINLGDAARSLGLEPPSHRAISDAMLCLELVQEMSRRR